ncbi:LLM class flavin-dependent oxidoreductase [Krasilnikoviella flava]|uniref:Flavin-dependent oxidoreductase, luciferase family (Includes alkanesulfonate monooxygenase SsuD and methylene tetrahydromethanopterin reductase) n=1 Tax=Krasilnikoviella flava TaxID=526729 RepID=A0A1T5L7S1_9MICO|nr:LLM class flavin-dependent oxidoreductase [Krasilnikoviella flava]SKC71990.1 Flavin-dependent oxidoreductase, luciferase family (includes alkanesulfonate monooxygenase SsuD and methylene tetrahydromethanopterin reductase) [Krasilnikoviella flava]
MPHLLPTAPSPLVLGVDLTAAGARPGVHRARGIVQPRSFDAERFVQLVRKADDGGLDLVTLDEGFLLHPGRRQVTGRLDAAVAAARVAPHTKRAGLVAAVDTAHVDPAHVAQAIVRVDQTSAGRAGWQVGLPTGAVVQDDAWAAQAGDVVAQVVRHWDGRATGEAAGGVAVDGEGRFRVDHDGIRFAVRRHRPAEGPAADGQAPDGTGGARPRQVRPPVVVSVRSEAALDLAARTADVARVAATAPARAIRWRTRLRDAAEAAGRDPDSLRVLTEAYVVLAEDRASAQARLELVEALEGPETSGGLLVVAGTPDDLAETIVDWRDAGASDGFLLRPSSLGPDLDALVDGVLPRLVRDGVRAVAAPAPRTLRTTLGLPDAERPVARAAERASEVVGEPAPARPRSRARAGHAADRLVRA